MIRRRALHLAVLAFTGIAIARAGTCQRPAATDSGFTSDRDAAGAALDATRAAREPLRGFLLGQPPAEGVDGPPSDGRHPCASDAADAKRRVVQFFGAIRQPTVSARDAAVRERSGLPPLVRTQYLPETIEAASVTAEPGLFRVEMPSEPDILFQGDDVRYPHLRVWYVLDCAEFEYVYLPYGRRVYRAHPYPFDDVDPRHLRTVRRARAAPVAPGETGERDDATVTLLDVEYANRLKLARTARPLRDERDLEALADFLYRIGRIPLTGFNTEITLVGRGTTATPESLILEDTLRFVVFDDAIVPGRPPSPPAVHLRVHVVGYDRATREVTHYERAHDTERIRQ